MQRISVERYRADDPSLCCVQEDDQEPRCVPIIEEYAGFIEGVRDDGTRWIMYIDAHGSPQIFWRERDEDGAVIGEGIPLQSDLRTTASVGGLVEIEKVVES